MRAAILILSESILLLVNGMVEAGYHIVSFDASHLSSGTYICRIEAISVENAAKQFVDVKKIVLLK